jgi:hypothetical protein
MSFRQVPDQPSRLYHPNRNLAPSSTYSRGLGLASQNAALGSPITLHQLPLNPGVRVGLRLLLFMVACGPPLVKGHQHQVQMHHWLVNVKVLLFSPAHYNLWILGPSRRSVYKLRVSSKHSSNGHPRYAQFFSCVTHSGSSR